jgi:hypothetical protein
MPPLLQRRGNLGERAIVVKRRQGVIQRRTAVVLKQIAARGA